jgi:hypothetical protein
MNLNKVVDGVVVPLTAAEIAERLAEEAAWVAGEQDRINQARIAELKQFLRDTDYVALSDYDKDKPEIIAQRQAAREELRGLGA